ncbi:hypothetical protein C2845_PM18G05200 [Panicum miliaceum]|uniref:Uncharacterized protein n=1 Tax=Panicum miliaceum TaxID=4540 RepID=A0A3L6PHC4_PANMI|nr:hypothetical protein C2845_PM18G05200 [Panicum miliaceum]
MAPTRAPTTTVNMCNELIHFSPEALASESCASPTPLPAEEEDKPKRRVEGGCGHHDSIGSSYHAYHAEGGRKLHTRCASKPEAPRVFMLHLVF